MISLSADLSPIIEHFSAIGRYDQIAYANQKALNSLADKVQANIRDHVAAKFNLKHKQWVLRSIKIKKSDRATKKGWSVTISVEYENLAAMEEGMPHLPTSGRALLAAQTGKLQDKIVRGSNALAMRNIGLGQGTIKPGMKGTNGVFTAMSKAGNLIVFQRTGRGKGKPTPIYRMTARIRRPAKLRFYDISSQTISNDYSAIYNSAIADVMRTMRVR